MPATLRLSDRYFAYHLRSGARGFHFVRRIWERCGGSPFIRVRTRFGAAYEVSPYGYVESFLLRYGFYESEVLEALRPYLGAGAVLWDIGSNLGLHAVAAKVISPATTVCAFEPVAELLDRVRAHAALNDVEVRCFSEALAAATEQRILHVPRGGPSGRASLLPDCGDPKAHKVPVTSLRADELISSGRAPAPTVIKLDVEGAEAEVLDGFGDYLKNPQLRAIVFEGSPGLVAPAATDAVGSRICRAGFDLRRLERQEPTHHGLENYLACRP